MTTINLNNTKDQGWPYQKRATSRKTKTFCKECLEAAEKMIPDKLSDQDKREMEVNELIVNGKLDRETIENELNPYVMKGMEEDKTDHIQSFPLLKDKVDLLLGEEWKRKFDWQVVVVNPDAITKKQKKMKERIYNFLVQLVMKQTSDKEDLQREIKKYDKELKYSFRDLNELRSNRLLNKLYRDLELKRKFNYGLKDLLVQRSEIFCTDVVAGKPDVRKVDPKNLKVIRSGNSEFIDDADIIIEESYESRGWIIDHYYKELSDGQTKAIDSGLAEDPGSGGKGLSLNYTDAKHGYPSIGWNDDMTGLIDTNSAGASYGGPKDAYGNIRVTRMVWKSLRKLGEITYIDEQGDKNKKIVDENYKPQREIGEDVEWHWVNEYWETTRIGKDIYVKMQPRPIQFRRKGNISSAGSGYTGIVKESSLVDLMRPFQVMYDIFMDRTKDAFMKAKGVIMSMDLSKKPRKWSMEKWLYYMEKMNIIFEDPFNEGNVGSAKGKLAGNMQQSGKGAIDMTLGSYIQQHIMMLQYIEQRIGAIAGIPAAREGQSSSNETATGVRNSVAQSYHITEPYFADHEIVKERVLENLLETAKYCYRENPELIQFHTSDMGNIIDEIGGEEFSSQDYGLDITTGANDSQLLEEYKALAQAAIQNDKMDLSTLGSIYSSPSMAKIRRELEHAEDNAQERQEMAAKREAKAEQAKNQQEQENKDKDREVETAKNKEDNKTKIVTELIKADSNREKLDTEKEKLDSQERISMEKILQDYDRLEEEVLKNDKDVEQKGEELKLKGQEIRERRQQQKTPA